MSVAIVQTHRVSMQRFQDELSRLVELAFDRYGIDLSTRLYLVGRKATGIDSHNPQVEIWAALDVLPEEPEGWDPIRPEPVPRHFTRDGLRDWFRQSLKREPLWLFAD